MYTQINKIKYSKIKFQTCEKNSFRSIVLMQCCDVRQIDK